MKRLLVCLIALMASDAFAAVTYPTLPRSEPDIRPASAVRTIAIANSTQLQQYLAGTDTTLCSGSPCGGVQYGDTVNLASGVTFTDPGQLPKPTGTIVSGGNENFVTLQTGSGVTCPASGTQAIPANDPLGRTQNLFSPAVLTVSTNTPIFTGAVDNIKYYRVLCVQVDGASLIGFSNLVLIGAVTGPGSVVDANYADHISFERVHFHCQYDFGCQHALQLSGRHIRVIDSAFTNAMSAASGGDIQAVYVVCGSGPFLFQNNSMGGMGENIFIGGGPMNQCPIVTAGVEYEQPHDVTLRSNILYRLLKWKRDDATYEPQADTAGSGTLGSVNGNDLTITSHGRSIGQYIRDTTTNEIRKITAVPDANTVTLASAFTTSPTGHSWRYNSANLAAKNCVESKGSRYVLVEYNICYLQWKDGQPSDFQGTAREFGYIQDWTIRYNLSYRGAGPGFPGPGDGSSGAGFGPSAYATARIHYHDNLWADVASEADSSLVSNGGLNGYYAGYINTRSLPYGQITTAFDASGSGTITATGATGSITLNSTQSVFASWMNGLEIVFNDATDTITAKGTISYTSATQLGVTVTSGSFPTTAKICSKWAIGPAGRAGTAYYQADSIVLEHLGWAAVDPLFASPWLFQGYVSGFTQSAPTNFVFRSNYAPNGGRVGSTAGGVLTDGTGGVGTGVWNEAVDTGTSTWGNNVLYGPQVIGGGNNSSSHYTGALLKCFGPDSFATTCKTAFHDPNHLGDSGATSGSVGFTDPDNNNFKLTGTYTTAAHDGTMIGPDWDAVIRRTAFTFQGTAYNSASGGATAVSGSSGAKAVAGSSGASVGGGCVRGIIAAFDSGC